MEDYLSFTSKFLHDSGYILYTDSLTVFFKKRKPRRVYLKADCKYCSSEQRFYLFFFPKEKESLKNFFT